MNARLVALLILLGVAALVGVVVFITATMSRKSTASSEVSPGGKANKPDWMLVLPVVGVIVLVMAALVIAVVSDKPRPSSSAYSSGPSSGYRDLSEETKKKMYYDMIATQDQNTYSNEWNEGVKQAAADYYNIPMDQVNNIIHEGVTKRWLTPPPP
ncbi:MAG: hypothetical protein NTY63_09745 [Candidatus Bipolaricaulota bacterium]|nr:hypothetical protein [Candidatus Bipolaricaulota bacterium]